MINAQERHKRSEERKFEIQQKKMKEAQVFIDDKINALCDMAVAQGHFNIEIALACNIDYNREIVEILRNDGYKVQNQGRALYIEW